MQTSGTFLQSLKGLKEEARFQILHLLSLPLSGSQSPCLSRVTPCVATSKISVNPGVDSKTWIIKITWYPKFPWSGTVRYESYFTRWRKERKWRDRTLRKKKKIKSKSRCWILISSFPAKFSTFPKLSTQRNPAVCHWLTGADHSSSCICFFTVTWERRKESWRQKAEVHKGSGRGIGTECSWENPRNPTDPFCIPHHSRGLEWGGGRAGPYCPSRSCHPCPFFHFRRNCEQVSGAAN